ncbi:MAG: hypothetical protein HN377_11495 [Alphaproteobacteria bacterium]|nr:hypothetical protein [Alphaproteobacteria bacterium]
MTIIQEDVGRLDRLISDISDASRLDAELSRASSEAVDIGAMLETLVDIHINTNEFAADGPPAMVLEMNVDEDAPLIVNALEVRIAQVFRNLFANAVSFNPPGGAIHVTADREDGWIVITIDDDGPGIAPGKEDAIFDRFYTQRRDTEKFGTHSGLGLSISRQIISAHDGQLTAANRTTDDGTIVGAQFTVRLPAG